MLSFEIFVRYWKEEPGLYQNLVTKYKVSDKLKVEEQERLQTFLKLLKNLEENIRISNEFNHQI